MKLKKILAVLLALTLALSTAAVFAAETAFTDVAADAYYAEAVAWAVENEITLGKSEGIFDPAAAVNRAEAVTFLWRLAGKPEPTQTKTFADVEADPGSWWYKTAVQWAVEESITYGTAADKFSPAEPCSRGMILTMLYRMEGEPFDGVMEHAVPEDFEDWTLEDLGYALIQAIVQAGRSEDGFADVVQGEYYELPIYWAMNYGILDENQIDMETRAVQPGIPCTRAEMVYFLCGYDAARRGELGADPAVEIGELAETVLLDADGAKITLTGIECDSYGDPRLTLTLENGTDKTLSVQLGDCDVNTCVVWLQAYVPVEDEDGWIFYANAVAAPGESCDFYIDLSCVAEKGIDAIRELELRAGLDEVEPDEDGYYSYVDNFAMGEAVTVKTSLYDETVSYDIGTGPLVCEKDGLTVRVIEAENGEYSGPQMVLFAHNGGSEDVTLEVAELKLDGVHYDTTFSMSVPAGKRSVETLFVDFDDENVPTVREAELSLETLNEDWEPDVVFDSVKISFE